MLSRDESQSSENVLQIKNVSKFYYGNGGGDGSCYNRHMVLNNVNIDVREMADLSL